MTHERADTSSEDETAIADPLEGVSEADRGTIAAM